ncbi:MAG TPA: ligand-binding protein SH3, partial [Candidatus Omnitrophica bacterium]|nr:ligand-binding protein SH3 [Candidatus Omnitrophota bacterium]
MKNILIILAVAASPVLELRGAIPLAAKLGFDPYQAFIISVLGNILPIPFLLFAFSPVTERLRKLPYFVRFFNWIEERTKRKAGLIEKYELMGLVLF